MWLPEIIPGQLMCMGLLESLARSQRSVRRRELGANAHYLNIGNAITE